VKLTAKTIDAIQLPVGKAEIIIYDENIPGFGIRIRGGGSRNFVHSYKIGTKNRRLNSARPSRKRFRTSPNECSNSRPKCASGEIRPPRRKLAGNRRPKPSR
jgi:hypothetical protein